MRNTFHFLFMTLALLVGSNTVANAQQAPAFSLASDNGEISLDQYRNKIVYVDFWASWCKPCRQEMPNVKKAYNDFHGKGFEILGISLDDSSAKFRGYVDEQAIPWPQIFDGKGWNSEVGKLYAVNSIPTTFLLDRNGKIRHRNLRGDDLYEAVKTLIAEE